MWQNVIHDCWTMRTSQSCCKYKKRLSKLYIYFTFLKNFFPLILRCQQKYPTGFWDAFQRCTLNWQLLSLQDSFPYWQAENRAKALRLFSEKLKWLSLLRWLNNLTTVVMHSQYHSGFLSSRVSAPLFPNHHASHADFLALFALWHWWNPNTRVQKQTLLGN